VYTHYLDAVAERLPLGWYLSPSSQGKILDDVTAEVNCGPSGSMPPRKIYTREESACLGRRIVGDL